MSHDSYGQPTLLIDGEYLGQEAGMVAINSFAVAMPGAPLLGVKVSGHGAGCGPEGLEACLVTKSISVA